MPPLKRMASSTNSSSSGASILLHRSKKARISTSDDEERGYDASDERDHNPAAKRRRWILPAAKPDSASEDTDEELTLPHAVERRLAYISRLASAFNTGDLVALAAHFPAHARSDVLVRGAVRHCRDVACAKGSDLRREARWVGRVARRSTSRRDGQIEQRVQHCSQMLATLPPVALDKVIAALPGYDGIMQGDQADVAESIAMYLDILAHGESASLVEEEALIDDIQQRHVRPRGRSASAKVFSEEEESTDTTSSSD
ncbi:hypothetical protein GGF50DRAFT_104427 [Schizophyllum commune]